MSSASWINKLQVLLAAPQSDELLRGTCNKLAEIYKEPTASKAIAAVVTGNDELSEPLLKELEEIIDCFEYGSTEQKLKVLREIPKTFTEPFCDLITMALYQ